MAQAEQFDVVVLGAGSGGYACALRAAQLGLSVALVERGDLGGTCLHAGCIPTKALLHAAEVADAARESGRFGVRASLDGIDMDGVNAYKDGVVAQLFKGLTGLVRSRGITLVEGEGRLIGPRTVSVAEPPRADAPDPAPRDEVEASTYTGKHLVLATGSHPRALPGLEPDGERVLTSDDALRLDRVPASVIVLGGGVIGCEFASVWSSFGAEVRVIEALPRLLPGEDEQSSRALQRGLAGRGVKVHTGTSFKGVEDIAGGVRVTTESGESFDAELLLVAVGREPSTAGLGLEQQGVATERGFVTVDERCRTGVEGVRAVGDVVPGLQLAHRGFAQGIFVAEDIAGLAPRPVEDAGIPRVTYSNPEVASVGLTEARARELHGDDVETMTYDLRGNGRSQILRTQGFVKLVRRRDGPVLGAHLVGARVGELIGEAQLVVGWEADPRDVAPLVHAHPTQAEALGEAHLALAGKPLHAHT